MHDLTDDQCMAIYRQATGDDTDWRDRERDNVIEVTRSVCGAHDAATAARHLGGWYDDNERMRQVAAEMRRLANVPAWTPRDGMRVRQIETRAYTLRQIGNMWCIMRGNYSALLCDADDLDTLRRLVEPVDGDDSQVTP